MLIKCNYCGGKARITSRDSITHEYSKLYCECLNPDCNHGFKMALTFEGTLHPPRPVVDKLLIDAAMESLKALPNELKQSLLKEISMQNS